jgi:hypothetical protein
MTDLYVVVPTLNLSRQSPKIVPKDSPLEMALTKKSTLYTFFRCRCPLNPIRPRWLNISVWNLGVYE